MLTWFDVILAPTAPLVARERLSVAMALSAALHHSGNRTYVEEYTGLGSVLEEDSGAHVDGSSISGLDICPGNLWMFTRLGLGWEYCETWQRDF